MYGKEQLLDIYLDMNQIRCFENTAFTFFQENKLCGSVHLYTGQEAVASSVVSMLRESVNITSGKAIGQVIPRYTAHGRRSRPGWKMPDQAPPGVLA